MTIDGTFDHMPFITANSDEQLDLGQLPGIIASIGIIGGSHLNLRNYILAGKY